MVRTIYTDSETDNIINKMKSENPEFNLSSWMKKNLRSELAGKPKKSIVELSNQLEIAMRKESEAKEEQEEIREKIKEMQVIEKQQAKIQKKKDKTKLLIENQIIKEKSMGIEHD